MVDFHVHRVAGHLGATIEGVDLGSELSDETIRAIRAEWLKHRVLFFRNQDLNHRQHIRFARRFGPLLPAHPYERNTKEDYPEILTVDPERTRRDYGIDLAEERRVEYRLAGWHSDITPAINPPAGGILRAEVAPEFGGETTWTNLVAAYRGLSPVVRKFIQELHAEHYYLAGARSTVSSDPYRSRIAANPLRSVHPVVRVHPETQEKTLYVNPGFTGHIVELSSAESRAILDLLFDQIADSTYTVRFRWSEGDVAFWDNRATAHLAPTDLDHLHVPRRLHRVALWGERPVGPDGRESVAVQGEPLDSI